MANNVFQNYRLRRKNDIVYVMGGCCQLCGYKKSIHALELHHINPEEKEFCFGKSINKSWFKLLDELKKCIQLCANCHREVHDGIIDANLKTSFSEDKAQEVSQKITNLQNHHEKYCPFCGQVISSRAKRCLQCKANQERKVERPIREELKEKIRHFSFLRIAEEYGVTDNAIRKWCKKYDLPEKSSIIRIISDEEWENI